MLGSSSLSGPLWPTKSASADRAPDADLLIGGYASHTSQTSSIRAPLEMLLTMIVSPFTHGNDHRRRAALFPVRIRIGVPPGGLGQRYSQITDWLDENCGADGWALTPAGIRGVLNDAVSIYFADATLAGAFVARWCVGSKVETAEGVFQVREDEPAPRVGARLHRTP